MKYVVAVVIWSLLQGCADSGFLDRTKKDESILRGTPVSTESVFAKSIVLIAEDSILQKQDSMFFGICTGLIIDRRTILTAAHCVKSAPSNMRVILNSDPRRLLSIEQDVYEVSETPRIKDNQDIALIEVNRDFPTDSLRNGFLSSLSAQAITEATVAGFGKTTILKDTQSLDYKKINGVLNQAQVELDLTDLKQNKFFLNQWKSSGVCKGDSGAPLFVKENGFYKIFAIAIGVRSNQDDAFNECANQGVYLNIENLKPWIRSQLDSKTDSL